MFCGHGNETCNLCCTDHRVMNELHRAQVRKDAGLMKDVDITGSEHMRYVQGAFEKRAEAEKHAIRQFSMELGVELPSWGTAAAQRLSEQMLAAHGSSLPPWPPLPFNAAGLRSSEPDILVGLDGLKGKGFFGGNKGDLPMKKVELGKYWQHQRVRIKGLWRKVELNGRQGVLEKYDRQADRYGIRIQTSGTSACSDPLAGAMFSLKETNFEIIDKEDEVEERQEAKKKLAKEECNLLQQQVEAVFFQGGGLMK